MIAAACWPVCVRVSGARAGHEGTESEGAWTMLNGFLTWLHRLTSPLQGGQVLCPMVAETRSHYKFISLGTCEVGWG